MPTPEPSATPQPSWDDLRLIEIEGYVRAYGNCPDEEAIAAYQNQKVAFKGLTVEAADDSGAAFLYNWDGSGTDGNDLYFNVSLDGNTYSFTVESYLCDNTTDVYKAVKELKVGDVVDLEGFLYWYEGINPHITAVSVQ